MCSRSLASIQNLSELLRKYPWALLPVTQLSAWFVTAPSDQNNCINKRRKALAVRLRWYHVRSLLNYNYETTNPLIVPPYGPCLDTCHCHMNTGRVISQERVFSLLASHLPKQQSCREKYEVSACYVEDNSICKRRKFIFLDKTIPLW